MQEIILIIHYFDQSSYILESLYTIDIRCMDSSIRGLPDNSDNPI